MNASSSESYVTEEEEDVAGEDGADVAAEECMARMEMNKKEGHRKNGKSTKK